MAEDPVCHMQVDEEQTAHTGQYGNQTYYFCSDHCKRKFEENSEHYLAWGRDWAREEIKDL